MKKIIKISMAMAVVAIVASGCNTMNKGKKEAVVLPQDRENIVKKKDQQIYTPEEIKRGVVKGDWSIETVMGKKAVGEKAPYIKFVPSEKRIYGNNGCNVLNGEYTYNAQDSTIRFSNMATTMMMCGKEGITDYEINTALDATKYYSWRVDNNDYLLTFYNENRQPVMTLLHQNFEFLNGTWKVSMIDGNKVDNDEMQLVFDMSEMKVHGNTGCNVLNGSIVTDMAHEGALSFQNMATTRMMCPDINQETALLVALEAAATVHPVDNNTVDLLNTHGNVVLRLVRAQ